jgi:hypothetical protein
VFWSCVNYYEQEEKEKRVVGEVIKQQIAVKAILMNEISPAFLH